MKPLLEIDGVSKRFGATRALSKVDVVARAGEVLALIGENGAGKSTLLKVLSGVHQPDAGEMRLAGQRFCPTGPGDARNSGVAMIYQELNLAPDLSIEDNLLLGKRGTGWGSLWRPGQRGRARAALQEVGLGDLDPREIAGQQSVATQQLIEIARALVSDARLILFDEPTSSLPHDDVQRLFRIVAQLKQKGMAIIYISHFLEEVREVADRYTVLRDGQQVGQGALEDVTDPQIISLMVGRDVQELFPSIPHEIGTPVLEARRLSGVRMPLEASFELRRGEILGLAGLVGSGRTELLRCLFGLDAIRSGEVRLDQRPLPRSVRGRMRAGLGLVSEDRKSEGLAQDLSLVENITLSHPQPYSICGWLNLSKRRAAAATWMERTEVKAHSVHQAVSELSGGNQQKVALARILHESADILLMDEPTKGIDVGTKAEIYRLMGELAARGKSLLFVSSYLPELMAVCDRIGVMSRGRLVEIRDVEDWTEDQIMEFATETQLAQDAHQLPS